MYTVDNKILSENAEIRKPQKSEFFYFPFLLVFREAVQMEIPESARKDFDFIFSFI